MNSPFRCGFVALVGQPNVGKSSLCNRLVGENIGIVTPKPQTTRRRLLGIATTAEAQLIFVDTPGVHDSKTLLNRKMVEAARQAARDADVVGLLVDHATLDPLEQALYAELCARRPLLIGNKCDLLPAAHHAARAAALATQCPEAEVHLVSATSGAGCDALRAALLQRLPEGPALYDPELYTTESVRDLSAELIRQSVIEQLHQEIPYGSAVEIEQFKEEGTLTRILANVLVERDSHKRIVVGAGGRMIRTIGTAARARIEPLVGTKVYLELHVKVRPDWTRQPADLKRLGLWVE